MQRDEFIKYAITMGVGSSLGGLKDLYAIGSSLGSSEKSMPVLFIGHGSPLNAIEQNEFSQKWQSLGKSLPKPQLILCI